MAHSGRQRHRDLSPGQKQIDGIEPPAADRVFRMSAKERQQIAVCLRAIDAARQEIEGQHDIANRRVVRELRASADRIYEILSELEELPDAAIPQQFD
jgi:hypothetical protein